MLTCSVEGIASWSLESALALSRFSRVADRGILRSLQGEVCLWDIRLTEPIKTVQAHQGTMTQLAVHEHAPIFAT